MCILPWLLLSNSLGHHGDAVHPWRVVQTTDDKAQECVWEEQGSLPLTMALCSFVLALADPPEQAVSFY